MGATVTVTGTAMVSAIKLIAHLPGLFRPSRSRWSSARWALSSASRATCGAP